MAASPGPSKVCTVTIGAGLLIGTRLGLASYLRAVPLIVLKGGEAVARMPFGFVKLRETQNPVDRKPTFSVGATYIRRQIHHFSSFFFWL